MLKKDSPFLTLFKRKANNKIRKIYGREKEFFAQHLTKKGFVQEFFKKNFTRRLDNVTKIMEKAASKSTTLWELPVNENYSQQEVYDVAKIISQHPTMFNYPGNEIRYQGPLQKNIIASFPVYDKNNSKQSWMELAIPLLILLGGGGYLLYDYLKRKESK